MTYEERCATLGISRGALAEGFAPELDHSHQLAPKEPVFNETRGEMRKRLGLGEGDMSALNPRTHARAKETGAMGGKAPKR